MAEGACLRRCSINNHPLKPLVHSSSGPIASIAEVVEAGIDQWMTYRRAAGIPFQVAFGHSQADIHFLKLFIAAYDPQRTFIM